MLLYSWLITFAAASADFQALYDGPVDFPKIIADGTVYTDETFTESDLTKGRFLYWNTEEYLRWRRLSNTNPDSLLFNTTSTTLYDDVKMYTNDYEVERNLAAIQAIAKSQAMVRDKFITPTREKTSGIYAIRLYLRGKPWVLTIDNYLEDDNGKLTYARIPKSGSVWVPLLLKAMAKAVGSYYWLGEKGSHFSALNILTGCPTFTLKPKDFDSASALFSYLEDATTAGYFMTVTTEPSSYQITSMDHTHDALLTATTTIDQNNTLRKEYRLADPSYSSDGGVMDEEEFFQEIYEVTVAHCREGYSSNWYDVEPNIGFPFFLNADVPRKDGDIYVSVDPFFSELMTWAQASSFLLVNPGFKMGWEAHPIITLSEEDYDAGDFLSVMAWVTWWGIYSDSSYTVNFYSKQDIKVVDWYGDSREIHMDGQEPSGFKKSSYRI